MIQIFQEGGRGGAPSNPPPLYEQLLPLPTPCFIMFLKRSFNDPHPQHPTSSIFHCYPLPIHHPFNPPKEIWSYTRTAGKSTYCSGRASREMLKKPTLRWKKDTERWKTQRPSNYPPPRERSTKGSGRMQAGRTTDFQPHASTPSPAESSTTAT